MLHAWQQAFCQGRSSSSSRRQPARLAPQGKVNAEAASNDFKQLNVCTRAWHVCWCLVNAPARKHLSDHMLVGVPLRGACSSRVWVPIAASCLAQFFGQLSPGLLPPARFPCIRQPSIAWQTAAFKSVLPSAQYPNVGKADAHDLASNSGQKLLLGQKNRKSALHPLRCCSSLAQYVVLITPLSCFFVECHLAHPQTLVLLPLGGRVTVACCGRSPARRMTHHSSNS